MNITAGKAIREARARLAEAGIETAGLDAEVLMAETLRVRREKLFLDPDRVLSGSEQAAFSGLAARRQSREPVARIVGSREFWSLEFTLNDEALVPRPDSETLVEAALEEAKKLATVRAGGLRILDLGTGSGCLLISLLHELPSAIGTGVDSSDRALACATVNAARHGVDRRARFYENNWFDGLAPIDLGGPFHIVVCNPPYIATADIGGLSAEVSGFDPLQALDGGPDGLDCYRSIAMDLPRFLAPEARAIIELGDGQAEAVRAIFDGEGFQMIAVRNDLGQRPRALVLASQQAL